MLDSANAGFVIPADKKVELIRSPLHGLRIDPMGAMREPKLPGSAAGRLVWLGEGHTAHVSPALYQPVHGHEGGDRLERGTGQPSRRLVD